MSVDFLGKLEAGANLTAMAEHLVARARTAPDHPQHEQLTLSIALQAVALVGYRAALADKLAPGELFAALGSAVGTILARAPMADRQAAMDHLVATAWASVDAVEAIPSPPENMQ